ncbi:uncharacterized protein EDB91DRAFT_1077662 [Suillus paluster]|uniref:uncharacterized protein n=1 Tax=Suillus paluster TaxID=48578 RepID=UPI001B8617CF|nr:uncharacterized protein EDB91DRAFT_1077662 [Suillus paluster]KAG1754010.1 hypothetical protein EDB91DRAFT_1077662 [Suillus paluster]
MFSFVPPVAGMFVWMKLHLDQYPSFAPGDEDTLETKSWAKLAENGVLFGPGWITDAGHFRVSFSNAEAQLPKFPDLKNRLLSKFEVLLLVSNTTETTSLLSYHLISLLIYSTWARTIAQANCASLACDSNVSRGRRPEDNYKYED